MICAEIATKLFIATYPETLMVNLRHQGNTLITQEVLQDRGLAHIID
jgi:hypothetical protein